MLGHKLVQKWSPIFDVFSTVRNNFKDIEKYHIFEEEKTFEKVRVESLGEIENIIKSVEPHVIVNAVGIIKQLPSSKDTVKSLTINSLFPHQLAGLAGKFGARLITLSTDCVFRGTKGNYNEEDTADAVDLYGKSKNLGEVISSNCLTIRTSIIGRELQTAHSLVEWFLSNRNGKTKGFVNAIYTGFPTIVLAEILAGIIVNFPNLNGLYHISSEPINKFDLLTILNEKYSANITIEPSDELKIDRSLDSTKFRRETGFSPLNWAEMIGIMAADETPYDKWRQ